jgi:hypothetical protein
VQKIKKSTSYANVAAPSGAAIVVLIQTRVIFRKCFFKFSFTHITPQKIKSDIKDRDKMELPLAILVVVGVFETISIAFTRRYILPIYPVATTPLSKPIRIENTTIPVARCLLTVLIITR